jgi:hypothetical protein
MDKSVFALRKEDETLYYNDWLDAYENGLFEIACIDEIYLDSNGEPIYEYKAGITEFSYGEVNV